MSTLTVDQSPDRRTLLDHRLHDVAWGLLLALTGLVWLVPEESIPQGAWLFGVAAVLLGVNVIRYASGIGVNGFSAVLGVIALLSALGRLWRTDLPLLAICLVIIGVSLVVKPFLSRAG